MAGNDGEETPAATGATEGGDDGESARRSKTQAARKGRMPQPLESAEEDNRKDLFSYWKETTNVEGRSGPLNPAQQAMVSNAKGESEQSTKQPSAAARCDEVDAVGASSGGEKWSPSSDIRRGSVAKFKQKIFGEGIPKSVSKGRRENTRTPSETSRDAPGPGRHGETWSPRDEIDAGRIGSIKSMWGEKFGERAGRSGVLAAPAAAAPAHQPSPACGDDEGERTTTSGVAVAEEDGGDGADGGRNADVDDERVVSEEAKHGGAEEVEVNQSLKEEVDDEPAQAATLDTVEVNINDDSHIGEVTHIDEDSMVPEETALGEVVEDSDNSPIGVIPEEPIVSKRITLDATKGDVDIDDEPIASEETTTNAAAEDADGSPQEDAGDIPILESRISERKWIEMADGACCPKPTLPDEATRAVEGAVTNDAPILNPVAEDADNSPRDLEEVGDEPLLSEEATHDVADGRELSYELALDAVDENVIAQHTTPPKAVIDKEPIKSVETTLNASEKNVVAQRSIVAGDGLDVSWTPTEEALFVGNGNATSATRSSSNVVDLTPRSSMPQWWSLLGCCRPSPSAKADPRYDYGNEDVWCITESELEKREMTRRIDSLSIELDEAVKAASRMQERLNAEIKALKTDLLDSKQDRAAKSSEVLSLQKERRNVRKSLVDTSMKIDSLLAEKDLMQKELSLIVELSGIATKSDEISAAKDPVQHKLESAEKLKRVKDWSSMHGTGWTTQELLQLRNALLDTVMNRDKLLGEISALLEEKKVMQKDLTNATRKNDELLGEKGLMQTELSDIATMKDEISSKYHSVQQEIESLQQKVTEITLAKSSEIESLQKKVRSVQNSLLDSETKRDRIMGEKDEILLAQQYKQREIIALQSRVAKKTKETKNLQNELKTVTAKSDEMRREVERVRSSLIDTTTVRDGLSEENGSLQLQIDNLQSNAAEIISAKEAEIENLQQELATARNRAEEKVKKLSDDLEARQSQIKIADNSVRNLSAQLNTARAEKVSLHEDTTAKVDEITKQKESQKEEMVQQIVSLAAEVEEANDAKMAASKMQEQLNIKVTYLEAVLLESRQDSAAKSSEIDSLQKELEAAQKSLLDTSMQIAQIENNMKDTAVAHERELKNLRKDIESVQTSLDVTTTKKDELSAKNCALQQQTETLQCSLGEVTSKSEAEIEKLQRKLKKAEKSLIDTSAANSNLQEEIKSLQSNMEEFFVLKERKRGDAEGKAERPTNELKDVQSHVEIANNSVETLSTQLNAAQAERDKLLERLSEVTKQKESQQENMGHRIESLSTELEHANEKLSSLNKDLNDAAETAGLVQNKFNIKVTSLETDLHESKQHGATMLSKVELLHKELEAVKKSRLDTSTKRDKLLGEIAVGANEADRAVTTAIGLKVEEAGDDESERVDPAMEIVQRNGIESDNMPRAADIPTERPTKEHDDVGLVDMAATAMPATPDDRSTIESNAVISKSVECSEEEASDEAAMTERVTHTATNRTATDTITNTDEQQTKKKKKRKKKRAKGKRI